MGLLGYGQWLLGISVNSKWKIIPFALALLFFVSALLSKQVENVIIGVVVLGAVILILRY